MPGPVPASPANRDYRPGFSAPLMAKDLGLAANALRDGGVDAPLGLKAAELYAAFAEGQGAELDFSAIVRTIRTQNGTRRCGRRATWTCTSATGSPPGTG